MICRKSYVAEREQETTGRSGVGDKALAFKPIGRGFAPRQPFLFFTHPRRRRVLIYQSYYRREETKYNRSEWCSGRALAFKTIGLENTGKQRTCKSAYKKSVYTTQIQINYLAGHVGSHVCVVCVVLV